MHLCIRLRKLSRLSDGCLPPKDYTHDVFCTIQDILKNAKIIRGGKKDSVTLGATVVFEMGGREVTYTLVGATEANPLEGKISNESPIGKALFGHRAKDIFDFNGKTIKIKEIKY